MLVSRSYHEVIDFISSGPKPEEILNFKPSEKLVERVEYLLAQKRNDCLTLAEKEELDYYLIIEHIMRMAKARAKEKVTLAA